MWLVCLIAIHCICDAKISAAESRQTLKSFTTNNLRDKKAFSKNTCVVKKQRRFGLALHSKSWYGKGLRRRRRLATLCGVFSTPRRFHHTPRTVHAWERVRGERFRSVVGIVSVASSEVNDRCHFIRSHSLKGCQTCNFGKPCVLPLVG